MKEGWIGRLVIALRKMGTVRMACRMRGCGGCGDSGEVRTLFPHAHGYALQPRVIRHTREQDKGYDRAKGNETKQSPDPSRPGETRCHQTTLAIS
jgi:hypothetical protein